MREQKMAFQVKVEYGGKCFATFLLENVSYDGLVSSIRNNCSSLAQLDSKMLHTAKEVKDCDNKKIFIQANKIDSPCPCKMRRVDFGMVTNFVV